MLEKRARAAGKRGSPQVQFEDNTGGRSGAAGGSERMKTDARARSEAGADRAAARAAEPGSVLGIPYKWVALGVTTVGALMFAIDTSIVVLALPPIMADLHADLVSMIW